jgi:nucleoside-diphosphate-sugar epimerase
MKVLVAGEGAVAAATVTALVEQGHEVRLLSPQAEATVRRWPRGVEARVGDVASSRGTKGAAEGCQVVIQLGAVREPWATTVKTGAGLRASGPSRIDVRGTRWLVAEAESAGAERFVLLSSLRYERSHSEDGRALRDAEDAARGFRGVWSIVRAGLVYAPGEGALASLATMVRTLPAIPVVDGGRPMLQPLWHEDLGSALARAAQSPDAAGQVLHVAGPERRRLSEVIDTLSELVGRRPVRLTVPSALATMGAEAATLLGIPLPARAGALAELDGDTLLPASIENALTSVLGVTPTLVEDGLRKLVADVPEQTPAGGSETIRRRRFRVDIEGVARTGRELRDQFRRRASYVLALEKGPPEGQMIKQGTLLSAGVPLRGLVGLRVAEIVPDAVTLQTVEGDPLAGLVTFRFRDQAQGIRAEIVVEAAAATLVDRLLASATGGVLEDLDWAGALERIVEIGGGRAPAGVQRDVEDLDPDEAAHVRERSARLREARLRGAAPPSAARPKARPRGKKTAARSPRPRASARAPQPSRATTQRRRPA